MRLKEYQEGVLARMSGFLAALAEARREAGEWEEFQRSKGRTPSPKDYCADAWRALGEQGVLPGRPAPAWIPRWDGAGRPIPNACLKIPTGGGKTLLAAHAVERIQVDYFRRQTGLVLWIVPSESIFKQTWDLLANRESPYRQTLERASGGRVRLLEKGDSFARQDLSEHLCVMLLMLQSSARRSKEALRMFMESGRFASFFPEVDDPEANNALAGQVPNLDTNDLGDARHPLEGVSIKHSLGNTMRLVRPVIVLDEGHKAYSETARSTLDGLNPSFLLELSATPNSGKARQSNVLVDVRGATLKAEQMIKLPINVFSYEAADWKHTLAQAHARLDGLAAEAGKFRGATGRLVRPIMLVRVERTGKEQRDGRHVHAEDARQYLIERLAARPEEIRVKSSSLDELGNEDLMAEASQVRCIITKDALREGWDCPFAYVLAILDRTSARTALTQMVGRVLRQPGAESTGRPALDQCYVYTCDEEVGHAVDAVRKGLEEEGMGDLAGEVRTDSGPSAGARTELIRRKAPYRNLRILLPRVLVREVDGVERLMDYDRDVLGELDWEGFSFRRREVFDPGSRDRIGEHRAIVDFDGDGIVGEAAGDYEAGSGKLDIAFLVLQLLDVIPNPWQGYRVLSETLEALRRRGISEGRIHANRMNLLDAMKRDLAAQVEEEAEALFREGLESGRIVFDLVSSGDPKLNFELAETLEVTVGGGDQILRRQNLEDLRRLFFEKVYEREFNGYERNVALHLDGSEAVHWWHRLAARRDYHVQGWQKHRIYPDFLVCLEDSDSGTMKFSLLETKGDHLKGSDDTEYKRRLFELLTEHSRNPVRAGQLELEAAGATLKFKMLMEANWRDEIANALVVP